MKDHETEYLALKNRILFNCGSRKVGLSIICDVDRLREADEAATIDNTLDLVRSMIQEHGVSILYEKELVEG